MARAGAGVTLHGLKGRAVAWVDTESTAGYLLPVVLLKSLGLEPRTLFASEMYAGTYRRGLQAVRDGNADVAGVYCPPEATGLTWESGVEEALPGESGKFSLVAYTTEAPNAGVVVGNALPPAQAAALEKAFVDLDQTEPGRALLRDVFSGMERFERAPPRSDCSLFQLAVASL